MRTVSIDPFWRTSVGFDRLFDLLQGSIRPEPEDNYPPYDIVRTGENSYRISLAVAGFAPDQINITVEQGTLVVTGRLKERPEESRYLYHGIAARAFERRFALADFVEVTGASLTDGLLQIELERKVPEAMKPRRIEIRNGRADQPSEKPRRIGQSKAA